jgi:hypothetical protein
VSAEARVVALALSEDGAKQVGHPILDPRIPRPN